MFSCSFLRQRAQLGRQRHTDGQQSVAAVQATGPARGSPLPERPIRPLSSAGNKKQTNYNTDHRTSITSLPRSHTPTITTTHLASHHQQPSFRCLTTHTRSWGWVVKHRPHPAIFRWLARTRVFKPENWCGTGPPAPENPTSTTPTNKTASRHHSATQSPSTNPTAADAASRRILSPKKRAGQKPHARRLTRTLGLPAQSSFSRLKIVLGSLGTDPGAGALPGLDERMSCRRRHICG